MEISGAVLSNSSVSLTILGMSKLSEEVVARWAWQEVTEFVI